jgi:fatty acid desaturase
MQSITISTYGRELRSALPPDLLRPRPRRLLWLPVNLAVAVGGIVVVAAGWGGLPVAALMALLIGQAFAGMAFVAHETLHGAVLRSRRARHVVGWLAFLPFMISPRLWTVWHNQVHHGHTKHPDLDPDAYPSLADYRRRRLLRVLDRLALGAGHPAGFVSLVLGLTGQSLKCLFTVGGQRRYMSRRAQLLAGAETLAAAAVWAALAVILGPLPWLFAFVLPLLVANAVVMAYILTNHGLSPYTEVNDPLLNSLSVTTPRLLGALHLNFGYHVEHHLFPKMSPAHAPLVSRLLRERWPERYQSMPFGRALLTLARTSRLHLDATTLVEPRTGRRWPTLGPAPAAPDRLGARP